MKATFGTPSCLVQVVRSLSYVEYIPIKLQIQETKPQVTTTSTKRLGQNKLQKLWTRFKLIWSTVS